MLNQRKGPLADKITNTLDECRREGNIKTKIWCVTDIQVGPDDVYL
jgi:hypothetical protein